MYQAYCSIEMKGIKLYFIANARLLALDAKGCRRVYRRLVQLWDLVARKGGIASR